MKKLTLLFLIPLLSGCSALSFFKKEPEVKPIEIQTKAVERTRLNLREPAPLRPKELDWFIITPENAEEVWTKLKEQNADLVLFGLTDDGYETLAITMTEIRNFIAQQRTIILKYKEYYEPEITDNK